MPTVNNAPFLKLCSLSDVDKPEEVFQLFFNSWSDVIEKDKLEEFRSAVASREEASATYLDRGLAVPHGRTGALDRVVVTVGYSEKGIPWPTSAQPAHLVIMLGIPEAMITGYLLLMQKLLRWHKGTKAVTVEGIPTDLALLERELTELLS